MCAICRMKDRIQAGLFTDEEVAAHERPKFYMYYPMVVEGPGGTRYLMVSGSGLVPHGEVQEIIQGLQDFYSRLTPDDLEILNMPCQDPAPEPVRAPKKGRAPKQGYVYLVKSDKGLYKIGRTISPDNRMKTFSVKLPFDVEYTLLIKTGDYWLLERQLHERFADKRKDGEWFDLSEDDVETLRKEYDNESES